MNILKKRFLSTWLVVVISFGSLFIYAFRVKPAPQPEEIFVKPVIDSPQVDLPSVSMHLRDSIEHFGMEFLGVPYVYGGTSGKGFDCSGFVYYVFDNFHIKVPRTSADFENFGQEIPVDSVQTGDILVFLSPTRNEIGHVGIVTHASGMESEFVHASSSKEMQVMVSSLKQPGYKKRFVKAIRVVED
jgi:hypothetical protein